ncbi:MAG: heavy metal translocating P-type ATPase [Cytophagaceae bacterium]|nr:heavy metal translocating P-type ATPase [Cytophagaceae bacterium]
MSDKEIVSETYPVKGMTCAACAESVESMIRSVEGVEQANVNFATSRVFVKYDPTLSPPEKLDKAVRSIGYELIIDKRENIVSQGNPYRLRLIVAALFSIPVVLLSMVFHEMPYSKEIMFVLTLPVIFYSGKDFYINAVKRALHFTFNMDTLIALGTGSAFLFSVFNTFFPEYLIVRGLEPHVYYESAAVIITLILLGKSLEENAKAKAGAEIEKLMGLQAKEATMLHEGKEVKVPLENVKIGDTLVIKPGEKIPVDGKVMAGNSFIDESMVTGEAMAVKKIPGDMVIGSTMNTLGYFEMRATKVGSDTMLAKIIQVVQEAQGKKAPMQKLADKMSAVFVPMVVLIAVITFILWYLLGPQPSFTHAFVSSITVLIIACPCALGLATPAAIVVGIGRAANKGVLIKDGEALQLLKKTDTLVVDKTGTLTKGKFEVTDVIWKGEHAGKDKFKSIILSLEKKSEHPLAEAIIEYFHKENIKELPVENFETLPGMGIRAKVDGENYYLGNENFIRAVNHGRYLKSEEYIIHEVSGMEYFFDDEDLRIEIKKLREAGRTLVFAADNKAVFALVGLTDVIKDGAEESMQLLNRMGIEVIMMTGDSREAAEVVANKLKIKEVYAEVLPLSKSVMIQNLQEKGKFVAMAGDGINDAPALAQADVGIAMANGTDIAIESSKMVLLNGDITKVAHAIKLSRATLNVIRQNLFWAFIFNIIGIPLAAGILYPVNGFLLSPMIAGAAMAFSSLAVVLNSLRLKLK